MIYLCYFSIAVLTAASLYILFKIFKICLKSAKEMAHMTADQVKEVNKKLVLYDIAWLFGTFILSLLFSIGIGNKTFCMAIDDFLRVSIRYIWIAAVVIIGLKYIEISKRKQEKEKK